MSTGKRKPGNNHVRLRELEVKLRKLAEAVDLSLTKTNGALRALAKNDDAKNQLITTLLEVLKDKEIITDELMKETHERVFKERIEAVKNAAESSPVERTAPETDPEAQIDEVVEEDKPGEEG